MSQTFIALYRPGPAWKNGVAARDQPPLEHGRYLLGLFAKGILKSAGPFRDDSGAAVVVEAADEAAAQSLVANDPAVAAKIFVAEVHAWDLVPWEQYLKK